MIAAGDSYRFAPASLTISRGDGVRWTLVAGPGHTVTFWRDSIPPGALGTLQRNMPRTAAPLASPLLAPHVAFGMIGTIIVR
jgi:plastocyanin